MAAERVLIVDDEPDFLRIVRKAAEDVGHECRGTTSPAEFKRFYAEFRPTIVVLDMVMPDMDGIDLITWLVQQGNEARIILISGKNPIYTRSAKILADRRGQAAVTTLPKPVRLTELRRALSGVEAADA